MRTYPTLYKRTATRAVQVWWMEQNGAGYRAHSGQYAGRVTASAWTYAVRKNVGRANETSAEAQATAEVEAAYVLKGKKGYLPTMEAAVTSDRFQCMLAEKYEDRLEGIDFSTEVWAQPKLDGIRCIANAEGLWSRAGNRIVAVPHIEEALRPLFLAYPDLILDGELYNHELKNDFNTIVSLVKKLKPTAEDLERSAEMVQYWIYDAPSTSSFSQRYWRGVVASIELPECANWVETIKVQSLQGGDAVYLMHIEDGFEGTMYRVGVGPYENKRSKCLLKRKERMDEEFEVLQIEEGVGNAAGMAKIAHLRIVLPTGEESSFKADICGTREECTRLLRSRDNLIGASATVEFQSYTPDGIPRFPKLKIVHLGDKW